MSTCDLTSLLNSACANKFNCPDQKVQQALLLQLLCEVKAGLPSIKTYDSGSFIAGASGILVDADHNLGGEPTVIQVQIIANAVDATLGIPVGTITDSTRWLTFNGGNPFTVYFTDTHIRMTTAVNGFTAAGAGSLRCGTYATGQYQSPNNVTNFNIRLIASRISV